MRTDWHLTAPATDTAEWDDLMESLGLTPSNRIPPPPPELKPIDHGSPGGPRLHRKRGEPVCKVCRTARNTYDRNHYAQRRAAQFAA